MSRHVNVTFFDTWKDTFFEWEFRQVLRDSNNSNIREVDGMTGNWAWKGGTSATDKSEISGLSSVCWRRCIGIQGAIILLNYGGDHE